MMKLMEIFLFNLTVESESNVVMAKVKYSFVSGNILGSSRLGLRGYSMLDSHFSL
jgi:hypothetical protein